MTTGGDASKLGERIPGIYFINQYMHIASSVNGNPNYYININANINTWYNVVVQYTEEKSIYWYTVWVNGKRWVRVKNPTAQGSFV